MLQILLPVINDIPSLDILIKALDASAPQNFVNIIKRMNVPYTDFLPYSTWSEDSYTRNCIKRTEHYEMILICWERNAQTPIHGHNGQNCWVYQLDGDIIEYRFSQLESKELVEISNWKLRPSALTFMDDQMGYHQLVNVSDRRSMTLHIYVNPINECEVFNESTKEFEQKSLRYDTHYNKPVKK